MGTWAHGCGVNPRARGCMAAGLGACWAHSTLDLLVVYLHVHVVHHSDDVVFLLVLRNGAAGHVSDAMTAGECRAVVRG